MADRQLHIEGQQPAILSGDVDALHRRTRER